MKTEIWNQIEKDFIAWDNEGHSNASQRQILDWFKDRLRANEELKKQGDTLYEKEFVAWLINPKELTNPFGINAYGRVYIGADIERGFMTLQKAYEYWQVKIKAPKD